MPDPTVINADVVNAGTLNIGGVAVQPEKPPSPVEVVLNRHVERMSRMHQDAVDATENMCDLNIILIHSTATAVVSERERKLAEALIEKIAR